MQFHYLMYALSGLLSSTPQHMKPCDSLRVAIAVVRTSGAHVSPTAIRIFLWNDTDSAISLLAPLNWPNESLLLEITAPDGAPVKTYNVVFPNSIPWGPESEFAVRIPPHSFVGTDISLAPNPEDEKSARFDLAREGTYQAALTLTVYPLAGGGGTLLRSNTIAFDVP